MGVLDDDRRQNWEQGAGAGGADDAGLVVAGVVWLCVMAGLLVGLAGWVWA